MPTSISANTPAASSHGIDMAHSPHASRFLLFCLFWIVAAASFSGFAGKWGLRDGEPRFGAEMIINATADKPFVYRRLLPLAAEFLDHCTPIKLKSLVLSKIRPERTFARIQSSDDSTFRFRYICIYYFYFFALLSCLYILRMILLDFHISQLGAVLAPAAFVLAFPYIQTFGGYYYDIAELLFASLAFLLAVRGKLLLFVLLALPATLNKETFFFILPTFYPLLRQHITKNKAFLTLAAAIVLSGVINVLIKNQFAHAAGGISEFHLFENIRAYLNPLTYLQYEVTYGLAGPSGAFLGTIAATVLVFLRSWPYCPARLRHHVLIAVFINLPLFVLFCAPGEIRNLSLLFVGFVVLIGFALDRSSIYLSQSTHQASVDSDQTAE